MDLHDAFQTMKRENFLPEDVIEHADENRPLPIGYGQTNSQPSTVHAMLEWLDVHEGQKVLDVGSGSGWTTALLSVLVGDEGHVYAVELVPELVKFGRKNCEAANITNVQFFGAGKSPGLPKYAPYDRILVSASAGYLPTELLAQLARPGKMVVPVGETIYEIEKLDPSGVTQMPHPGYLFVPYIA